MARPGTFQKGRSGNPGGRPKVVHDVQAAAREHTALAMAALAEICADVGVPAMARMSAASALLDRAWGKPIARNVNAAVTDPKQMSDAELVAIINEFRPATTETAEDAAADNASEPGSVH
jgi:hypothetical protein